MPTVILAATADAGQSNEVIVRAEDAGRNTMPAHFTCPGIAGAETGDLQKKNADDTWSDYYVDGTQQQVTATNTGVVVYAPGIYRIDKTATVAAVPVELSTGVRP